MIKIVPAIDIIEGKCVRLSQGDYGQKKIYNENPLEVAKMFEDNGIQRLHLVDLDGAKAKHVVNAKVLDLIATRTNLQIDFGGGIKTENDLKLVFNCGAMQATIGSVAVTDKELFFSWLQQFGAEKLILGADVKDKKIAVSGWLDVTEIGLIDFLEEYKQKGVQHVLCTDISKDGMLQGTAMDLYKELNTTFPTLNFIASGGITHIHEIDELNEMGIHSVIIGKAIYEGSIKVEELKRFLI
jgi:phosphoribosylformimino-5-aminoimidazole carboxamide ribotide isomerase